MAYDEGLAERIRGVLPDQGELREQRMFGGLAFMLDGHMLCGVVGDSRMLRLGPEMSTAPEAVPRAADGLHRTNHESDGVVDPGSLKGAALQRWVSAAAGFGATLPAKQANDAKTAAR